MIRLKEAIIVEGKYDKICLSSFIDALIIETGGFRIFKDKEKRALIRHLAEKNGLIIMTDSDSAGFVIRNHIKNIVGNQNITNVYIPEILGKEKRKATPSKEGLLGVEGLEEEIIIEALKKFNVTGEKTPEKTNPVTKSDLFSLSLSGNANSNEKRQKIYKKLGIPSYLSVNAFLDIINSTMTKEEFIKLAKDGLA
ncbi:MAG: DUF4093 domain-containing protein [Clostridia bacterium]|nr:DUF4093 domain-containing protein [Clostridia bacterium]